MKFAAIEANNIPMILCGIFYAVLCIFSIVTGIMYARGTRELNPLELSDRFVAKMDDEEIQAFARKMGWVTFVVGIVQGLTSFAILKGRSIVFYIIAIGFTLFSIASVTFKLKGKISLFAILKMVAYILILIVLFLPASRNLFF